MTIALGPWAWPDRPSNYTNIGDADRWNLRRWGGGIPFLAYAWADGLANWIPDNWTWLAEHGYRECVLRLWFDGASSDNPLAPPSPQAALDSVAAQVEAPVKAGIQLIGCQIDNEPDLERRGAISPSDYAAWCLEFIRLWWARFPEYRLISPPLAQDSPEFAAWERALLPVIAACDYAGVHYYWGRKPGDELPGAIYSPEWWRKMTLKPQIVAECGNVAIQHDLAPVLRRWATYPWLRSYHVFVLSSPGFPQFNYSEATANVLNDLIREWRTLRRYPAGATLPPVPVTPPGGVDVAALTDIMNHLWRTKEALVAVKDVQLHTLLAELHAEIEAYKQAVGL